MAHTSRSAVWRAGWVAALPLMVACAERVGAPGSPALNETPNLSTNDAASVLLCKIGPAGTTADFTVTADGPGSLPLGSAFTLNAGGECILGANMFVVWQAESPRPDPLVNTTLTVTEVGSTAGTSLSYLRYAQYLGEIFGDVYPPATSATITTNYAFGGWFKFENVSAPKPPGGGEGCTPGYWKQPQHFDSWPAPYTPNMLFSAAFGSGAFGNNTMLYVLSQGGGGLKALGRHAVAALLNAASGGVDYTMTVAGVIAAFNDAYASGDYEAQKNLFAFYNEQGCPLN